MDKAKKSQIHFVCSDCGDSFSKWHGQCLSCQAWNSLKEFRVPNPSSRENAKNIGKQVSAKLTQQNSHTPVQTLTKSRSKLSQFSDIQGEQVKRLKSGFLELDRILGGGIVRGSLVLLGGDPGIGKSTLLLQFLSKQSQFNQKVIYVTGEESLEQIKQRAQRLNCTESDIKLLAESQLEVIFETVAQNPCDILVIDSIQTCATELCSQVAGSVNQLRECTAQLVAFAKQSGVCVFISGHVTKEGALAGPRVLEHMVDTVLSFEGEANARYRVLRSQKNRFGASNEMGVFVMGENGLSEVKNPSAIFLSRQATTQPGSAVVVTYEGSKPLLLEVQALVDATSYQPRRNSIGIDSHRLTMLLAILNRHGGLNCHQSDVFVNVVGGIRIQETASDLAVLMAIFSSMQSIALPHDLVIFGEVGLSGEIRPVVNGQLRLAESAKHGFQKALIPNANRPPQNTPKHSLRQVIAVKNLKEAIEWINHIG